MEKTRDRTRPYDMRDYYSILCHDSEWSYADASFDGQVSSCIKYIPLHKLMHHLI